MIKKQTQAYSEEFRKEAVRRSDKKRNTAASVGRELGISAQQIYPIFLFSVNTMLYMCCSYSCHDFSGSCRKYPRSLIK